MRSSFLMVGFITFFFGSNEAMFETANKNLALNSIVGAAFGAAGQRCMAISVGMPLSATVVPNQKIFTALLIGETKAWIPELVQRANKLEVNGGFESNADL
jgi:malonate-semialdehyde dehydrogenase (acetylating)/methylmalonate-semialdehyde dehydrogenase